jgi:hypothetical protein
VILKNGTEQKGYIKHIDPTDALTIDIAGVETQIKKRYCRSGSIEG